MDSRSIDTERVIRRHLQAFREQQGLDAILSDYGDDACFLGEATVHRGKQAIRGFFEGFIAALPPRAIADFALRSLRVEGDLGYITWSAGPALPLGTDTFLVRDEKIVAQTFALYSAGR